MTDFPLKTYRDGRGLFQSALARELNVSSVTVSRWESGARKIDERLLSEIAQKTGIPARELRPDLAVVLETSA